MLIGIFSELDAPGGVQRAGRHLAAVLTEFARSRSMECRIFSLNDSPELHRMEVGGREFVFTGSERIKSRFISTAIRSARRHAKLVVAGHPNLAPVTQTMRLAAPRLKTIVCTHGIDVWEPLPTLRRNALGHASLVLAPSQNTADHVITQQRVDRERVRVLPWALDPEFEALLPTAAKSPRPRNFPIGRVILTVGRWLATERYKGMDTLITAMPRLLPRYPDLQLVLVGQGDDQDWLSEHADKTGVLSHVHFLSGLSYSQLVSCYAACEIFALPSAAEGFGLVYLEAMACCKPVIAGAHGGAPEVVSDGVSGYLVPHGDTEQLTTALETLLADPALARNMGIRGCQRVQHEFRFGVFAKALKKILREQCES